MAIFKWLCVILCNVPFEDSEAINAFTCASNHEGQVGCVGEVYLFIGFASLEGLRVRMVGGPTGTKELVFKSLVLQVLGSSLNAMHF